MRCCLVSFICLPSWFPFWAALGCRCRLVSLHLFSSLHDLHSGLPLPPCLPSFVSLPGLHSGLLVAAAAALSPFRSFSAPLSESAHSFGERWLNAAASVHLLAAGAGAADPAAERFIPSDPGAGRSQIRRLWRPSTCWACILWDPWPDSYKVIQRQKRGF